MTLFAEDLTLSNGAQNIIVGLSGALTGGIVVIFWLLVGTKDKQAADALKREEDANKAAEKKNADFLAALQQNTAAFASAIQRMEDHCHEHNKLLVEALKEKGDGDKP